MRYQRAVKQIAPFARQLRRPRRAPSAACPPSELTTGTKLMHACNIKDVIASRCRNTGGGEEKGCLHNYYTLIILKYPPRRKVSSLWRGNIQYIQQHVILRTRHCTHGGKTGTWYVSLAPKTKKNTHTHSSLACSHCSKKTEGNNRDYRKCYPWWLVSHLADNQEETQPAATGYSGIKPVIPSTVSNTKLPKSSPVNRE